MTGSVVVIRPGAEPAIEPAPADSGALCRLIGCQMLEMLPLMSSGDISIDVWFDEEGRLTDKPLNRYVPIRGRGAFDVLGTMVIAAAFEAETVGMDMETAERWRAIASRWPVPDNGTSADELVEQLIAAMAAQTAAEEGA